jgi:uncharacterized phage protein (TIGR01671 family)
MREILFRAKRHKDYGEGWVCGVPFVDYAGDCIMKDNATERVVDPDTVGQYTGLTDKNGTKIFEGDVVKAVLPPEDMRNGFEWMPGMVSYAEGAFGIAYSKHNFVPFRSFASSVRFEVIGNIRDNPGIAGGGP